MKYVYIFLTIFGIDLLSKKWLISDFETIFNLQQHEKGMNPYIVLITVALIVFGMWRAVDVRTPLTIIAAGATSNYLDVLPDNTATNTFITFFGTKSYAFNVADIAIIFGVIYLWYLSIRRKIDTRTPSSK